MNLDHVAANFMSEVNLFADWIDEEADRNLMLMEGLDNAFKLELVCLDVQPIFGRQFPAVFRNEGNEVGNYIECYPDNFVGGSHFEIKSSFDRLAEGAHIGIADMAAVFSEVTDDAAGAGSLADLGRNGGVWFRSPTGIPKGGNMIYVNG
jgi:hypothetical protein